MSEMPSGPGPGPQPQREVDVETGRTSAPDAANAANAADAADARQAITVDLDRKLDKRLRELARWRGVSEKDLLADAIEQHLKVSGQRSVTVQVSDAAAARLAAAAATIGMSEEELIAEAIDYYSPTETTARFWPALGIPALLAALPLVLMFVSPADGPSWSAAAWAVFASAMLACCIGAVYLISTVLYAEWLVIRYGVTGLVSAAACGAMAVLSAFAYVYWMLGSVRPASFTQPLARVDAIYFTLGTFTTTGTGRFAAQSALAELLVCCQIVLGWGFVAVLVALLVPRAAAARKRLANGRIIVRTESRG
jgi:voltage-gated potassium channel